MKARNRLPKLRLHKATGQGFVELSGRRIYLGSFGQPETQARYSRMLAEWLAAGRRLPVAQKDITVVEVVDRYMEGVTAHYRAPDGSPSPEVARIAHALRPLVALYGTTPAAEFGPRALKAVRAAYIDGTAPRQRAPLSRRGVNAAVQRVRRCFKWAVAEELLAPAVLIGLAAVEGLRRGAGEAREREPVRPVPEAHVQAVLPYVSAPIAAMIQLQLLTGCRPGEVCIVRPCDIDRASKVWVYRPPHHKTAHFGMERQIFIGPKAQAVLSPFLLRDAGAYCFSPREAEEARRVREHAARVTPLSCGNRPGTNRRRRPEREPGEFYDVHGYRRAIERACAAASRENVAKGLDAVPVWSPNRLRHNAATALRRDHGLDLAGVVLGHATRSLTTAIYAEADVERARRVMEQVG